MIIFIWIFLVIYLVKLLIVFGVFIMVFWFVVWLNEGIMFLLGFFGEMYMNFGWFGLIVGGLVVGFLYGLFYCVVCSWLDCDLMLGWYVLFVSFLLYYFCGEVVFVMVFFLIIYFLFWFIIKLFGMCLFVMCMVF